MHVCRPLHLEMPQRQGQAGGTFSIPYQVGHHDPPACADDGALACHIPLDLPGSCSSRWACHATALLLLVVKAPFIQPGLPLVHNGLGCAGLGCHVFSNARQHCAAAAASVWQHCSMSRFGYNHQLAAARVKLLSPAGAHYILHCTPTASLLPGFRSLALRWCCCFAYPTLLCVPQPHTYCWIVHLTSGSQLSCEPYVGVALVASLSLWTPSPCALLY